MPFLFKNKENQKWISFDNNSSTYNNRNITLSDCQECEENTIPADMPDSVSDEYMIRLNNNNDCIFPDSDNNLISGQCNTSDRDVYVLKKLNDSFLEQSLPNALKVSIGFDDNRTAMVNDSIHNWGKELTTATHYYESDESKENSEIYTIIKDPQLYEGNNALANPKYRDFITKNHEIRCKLFHVIEEYNSSKQLVAKTIYRLKYIPKTNIGDLTDASIAGIFMFIKTNENELSNSSSQSNDSVVAYFGKSNYQKSNLSEINMDNFSRAHIGTILQNGSVSHGYVDTSEYGGGIIIKNDSSRKTIFRVIPNDSIFNRMIKYSYPPQGIGNSKVVNVNMSSFINPKKKIIVSSNNKAISKNVHDQSEIKNGTFNIVPISEPFSVIEGYSNYSIADEINRLNALLQSSTSFEAIISHIETLLNSINQNNAEDEYAHIVNIYKTDLENIRYCFGVAKKLYTDLSLLHKNMTDNYLKIGLNNIYGNTGNSGTMMFDDNLANSVVKQLDNLTSELTATKSRFKNNYNLSLIEVNTDILFFLVNIFKYFQHNHSSIKKHVDAFFDYNDAKVYIDYCKDKNFLSQIKIDSNESFNYDNLIILSTGTLKQRIQSGENLKNKSKTFFDIDFGEIYNQLFVDATSGSRAFVNTRIAKILHKDQQIVTQFINANNGQRGVMHHYHDFLISQKEYYRRFLEIKGQNNKIIYFKNSLPDTSIPMTIFEHYLAYGKTLQWGDSLFFNLMNYYSGLATSSSNDSGRLAEIFLSLFKNLRYYKDTGVLIPSLDYSDIKTDNLYKYYENNHFINKKSEPSIISTFMGEYDTLANMIETNNGNHDGIISINDPSLKISEPFTNIENFDVRRANAHYQPKPSIIADNYDTNLFNDAFSYQTRNKDYVSLGEYLKTEYSDGEYNPDIKTASCSSETGLTFPNIVMSYSCGNKPISFGSHNSTTSTKYKSINDFFTKGAQCSSSIMEIYNSVTLEYTNDNNTCKVMLVMNNLKNKSYTVSEGEIPHTDYLEAFDNNNPGFDILKTTYSGDPNDDDNHMDYLEDVDNSANSILYNSTSNNNQRFFRLYIKDKKIMLDYKLARGLAINSEKSKTDMKGMVDPNNKSSNKKKIIYLYKNDKNVGENVNKSLYIDSAGVSHNIDSGILDTEITKTNESDGAVAYANYKNYCYSGTLTESTPSKDSVAKFKDYYLTQDQLKNVYPALEGPPCVDGNTAGILKLKKNAFDFNYGACMTDPYNVNMTSIEYYKGKKKNIGSSNEFSDEKCDKKQVFLKAVEQFKSERNAFRNNFEDMIEKLNELNENELEMLNGTQESIENIKETIREYNELYEKANKNEGKKTIIDAQTDDAKIVLKHSQHGMALMGIGAIGATMFMFNYMKK